MPVHRNSPAVPLTSARLLDVLDRMYDLEAVELDWMRGIGEAICPLVDCGAGVNVWTASKQAGVVNASIGLGHDVELMKTQFFPAVPFEILVDDALVTSISNADRCPAPHVRRYAPVRHAAMGVHSYSGLNGSDLEHGFVSIGIPAPSAGLVFWPVRQRSLWERISSHLGGAFRMRNRKVKGDVPGVVVDARGRLQHIDPGIAAGTDLVALRQAIAAVDRARRTRMTPEAVLDAWRALYSGRWSIVESVERDGRRFLVARPNAPLRDGEPSALAETVSRGAPRAAGRLSAQESRVLAALAQGHSNKLIAYELGLAISTVATLLARAARKLGCRSRIELARAGRARAQLSVHQRDAKAPR